MLSNLFSLGLFAILLPQTTASPTPGNKGWRDNRPSGVPVWNTVGAEPIECGDSCSNMCWQFTKSSIKVDGSSNFALYAGFHAKMSLGGEQVVPERDIDCHACKDLVMSGDNNGWTLTLKTEHSKLVGPLPIKIEFPYEVALFSYEDKGPFMSDQVITPNSFDCNAYGCGGGNNPMSCTNCVFHAEYQVYHATPIEDCSYWEE